MKKTTVWLLTCLMIFTLCACGSKNSGDTQVNSPETTLTEENNSLSSAEAAYIYNKAYSLASTWFNFSNEYWNFDDSFIGANGCEYYAVNHETINSVDALKNCLCEYFSENLFDSIVSEVYVDKDGKLYQQCFVAGDLLPTYYLNFTKAALTSEAEEKTTYNITVTYRFEDDFLGDGNPEKNETVNIAYVQENGNWVIDNNFNYTLYSPYEWDGKSIATTDEDVKKEENTGNQTGKIVTETSDNVMMAFYNEETKEFNDKAFALWAGSATIVEFERSYPKDLNLTHDTSLVKLDSSYALDISEAGDSSVVAYLTTDKSDIILHIAGKDGVVMANENSSHVFDGTYDKNDDYVNMKTREVRFNNCFNTSNATSMVCMFRGCDVTTLDVSGFDTSNVTSMMNMFGGCNKLTELDVSNFNTSNVTNMSLMFSTCTNLVDLNLSGFNTEKVTNMDNMFSECKSLTALNLSDFNTPNVTSMYALFDECISLVYLDISNFDTSNVTDMGFMFAYCEAITSLDLSNFSTSNVTSMKTMFYNCKSLTSIDVSSFDTTNVTNFSNMFNSCSALTTLDVSNFNTSKCKNASIGIRRSVFEGCYNAEIIYNGQVYKYGQVPDLYVLEDDFFNVEK